MPKEPLRPKWSAQLVARIAQDRFYETGEASRYPGRVNDAVSRTSISGLWRV